MDTENEESESEEYLDDDTEAERLAAALADLPDEGCGGRLDQLWHHQANNVAGIKSFNLLELSSVISLLGKLHLSGIQLRGLPQEFTPSCISSILMAVKPILCKEPSCLQVSSPVVLFGDLHGEFHTLVKLTDLLGKPSARSYLFLGDYVDRGPHSLETMLYLLLMKCMYPDNVFVLRGNHEDRRVYRFFNFEDDLVRTFGLSQGQSLSSLFHTVLSHLPVCAILNKEIFCCHGGLSPHFNHPKFASNQQDLVRRVNELTKPVLFRKSDFVADLLWADPLDLGGSQMPNLQLVNYTIEDWMEHRMKVLNVRSRTGSQQQKRAAAVAVATAAAAEGKSSPEPVAAAIDWMPNPRGCSYVFSKTAFAQFMSRYRLNWLVRGHMFVSRGHRECFDGRCVTLFSAADYAQKYHNIGAVIAIDAVSDGRTFPGRIMRFAKHSLLRYAGQLPRESEKWPHEISQRYKANE